MEHLHVVAAYARQAAWPSDCFKTFSARSTEHLPPSPCCDLCTPLTSLTTHVDLPYVPCLSFTPCGPLCTASRLPANQPLRPCICCVPATALCFGKF
eukprot:353182-Chlamydomonas_euryale.AAC.2